MSAAGIGASMTHGAGQAQNPWDRPGSIPRASDRTIDFESLSADRRQPLDPFRAAEDFTIDWHPLGDPIRPTRALRFGAVVVRAAMETLISWDTAAEWLETREDDVRGRVDAFRELYPDVFPQTGQPP